jgi:multimeric flavodoxin WrbA
MVSMIDFLKFIKLVGVFLPRQEGTSLSFLRDILKDQKSTLKAAEVMIIDVPNYQELSVKSLYDDAMKDPVLSKYLPSKDQLSKKMPDRRFFFGIIGTLRR